MTSLYLLLVLSFTSIAQADFTAIPGLAFQPYWMGPFSIYSGPDKLVLPRASEQRFEKQMLVLKALGVPEEPSAANLYELGLFDQVQTKEGFEKILTTVDPHENLKRYANWNDDGVWVYQDRDTKKVLDFSIQFKKSGSTSDPHGLSQMRDRTFSSFAPLKGVRIALDPGHMGSSRCGSGWDSVTGKYVSVGGRCVSEGTIALHVALILGDRLQRLGAEVLLTRTDTVPVSSQKIETFDLKTSIDDELRQATDTPWFDLSLNSKKTDTALIQSFQSNPEVQKIKNGSLRGHYFIFHEDLSARTKMINAFKPNLTLILHFDASKRDELQNGGNFIRAFIPGNIKGQELSTREQRAAALRTLVDGVRYSESLRFSQFVTTALSSATRVPLKKDALDFGGIKVTDGVYARNLALTRSVTQGVLSYLELLYYNYTPEHELLWKIDRTTDVEISGKKITVKHSSRIDDIVQGLTQGILDYVYSPTR